ncbi:MAG: Fic family protein [Coriobacteriaceae bacterium]|nr:Fic family protein [Coriobacteriaceae bacterium]
MSLKGAFSAEATKSYTTFNADELKGFCHTIAFLWQIHPFYEGNTRTVAVFSELYLNQLGFDLSSEPFEAHARYYRDALVRAIYRNAPAEIFPDESFLIRFYENTLGLESNELSRKDLFCQRLFEDPSLSATPNLWNPVRKTERIPRTPNESRAPGIIRVP